MKAIRSRGGFSLIELLTVIAIIAILAGIIFPVMGAVKRRAKQTQCMTNLKQIAMAVQMFKQDNNHYPKVLSVAVQGTGTAVPMDQVNPALATDGIYPEYCKGASGASVFHCPLSPTTKLNAVAVGTGPDGVQQYYYAYDSYSSYTPNLVLGTTIPTSEPCEVHYAPTWAADVTAVAGLPAYDSSSTDANDYQRQLRFRNPDGNTVITWCNYHGIGNDKIPVLFLNGTASMVPFDKINGTSGCKWRTKPSS